MKAALFITICILLRVNAFTQNYYDIVRFSEKVNSGDARYVAMGAAFSSLGANFASISDNPAAIGVFNKGGIEFSLNNKFANTETKFLDQSQRDRDVNLSINNFGILSKISLEDNDLKAKNINLTYTLNRVNDFNSCITMQSENSTSSMTDYFLKNIQSVGGYDNADYMVQDAYNAGLVMLDSVTNTFYSDFIRWGVTGQTKGPYGLKQINNISTSGRLNDNVFGAGVNFNDNIFLGGSFDFTTITYEELNEYIEEDNNDIIPEFGKFDLLRTLKQEGRGLNLKLGLIYKPLESFRLGISYHFPSNCQITENYSSYFKATYNSDGVSYYINSPEEGNGDYTYSYSVTTPGRLVV